MALVWLPIALFFLPVTIFFLYLRKGSGEVVPKARIYDGVTRIERHKNEIEEDFVKCIDLHKGELIQMVVGEGDYEVFTERVGNALTNTELPPEVIIGPFLSVDEERKSCLVEGEKEGKIKLYRSNTRHKLHFRVSKSHLYIEKPHSPMATEREYTQVDNIPFEIGRYQKWFEELKEKATLIENPTQEFLFLAKNDLKELDITDEDPIDIEEWKKILTEKNISFTYSAFHN